MDRLRVHHASTQHLGVIDKFSVDEFVMRLLAVVCEREDVLGAGEGLVSEGSC